jgi:gamma-D-glutamyl-L-lysine dipeptidyl-peptidase
MGEVKMQFDGVVTDSVANLYRRPDTQGEVITQAILGTGFSVENSQDGWHSVILPDQYHGWIEGQRVRIYAPGEAVYPSTAQVAEIRNLFAFLYREREVSLQAPARRVTLGTRLEATAEEDDWVQVRLPEGLRLWVQKGAVALTTAAAPQPRGSIQQILATARRFLGLPYLWGGTTPLGLDCSGFVQLVHRLHGIQLLRDAHIQYTQPGLVPIAREDLQAGDLIFFGRTAITHVGLYLGAGEFIHATTHQAPVVQISHLDEPHWTELYQGARRP